MTKEVTILEGIIADVAMDLYNKWCSALPEDEKNEESFRAVAANANETSLFVIQNFMNRFNEAASEFKN